MMFRRLPIFVAALILALALGGLAAAPARAQNGQFASVVSKHAGLEGRVMWMDGTANLGRLNSAEKVAQIFDKCVDSGVNVVVVDVKPLSGHVLYKSAHAPKLTEWKGETSPADYDLLATAVAEARKRGLQIYANINVFSNGHKLFKTGPIYARPEWQSIVYEVERTCTAPNGSQKVLALDTNHPPQDGQVIAFEPFGRLTRALQEDEAAAIVMADQVVALVDGAVGLPADFRVPGDGYMLVGKGEGARWLLSNVEVGETLNFRAQPKLLPITEAPSEDIAMFASASNPLVREYLLKIVDELANYDVDGIVFDRMRYASFRVDFSPQSRDQFETFIGRKLERFPEDVITFSATPGGRPTPGPAYKEWLEWRARNIKSWLTEARQRFLAKRPEAKIAVYVGASYPTYYNLGVNWGSEKFAPGYDWMTTRYPETGYAELLDWITTGCYYSIATRSEAIALGSSGESTVEAAATLATTAVNDAAFHYAGLYLQDYENNPAAFRKAIRAAQEFSQGVMIFDLSHMETNNWWGILKECFAEKRQPPHTVPSLLPSVRRLRDALLNPQ